MLPEIKAAWIEALRSGNFKQGQFKLRKHEGGELRHCCLGVLCDTVERTLGVGAWNDQHHFTLGRPDGWEKAGAEKEESAAAYVPQTIEGLIEQNMFRIPGLIDRQGVVLLWSDLNDELELTFDQIADIAQAFV